DGAVDDESEIPRYRLEGREFERGLGTGRLLLDLGNAIENHFERHQRAGGPQRLQRAWMQLAEISEHILRADLDRARAARMQPGSAAGDGLQRLHRRAG